MTIVDTHIGRVENKKEISIKQVKKYMYLYQNIFTLVSVYLSVIVRGTFYRTRSVNLLNIGYRPR